MSDNPLISKLKIPGETHKIPSQGLFYTNGELAPNIKNGELHIYPMSAMDELIMKTPDKLFSGDAVKEVFTHCIPGILKPEELLIKDIDFLTTCLRKISYGDRFEVNFKHICENAEKHKYVISMEHFIKFAKVIDPTKLISDFNIVLENGQNVIMEPMRYNRFIDLMHRKRVEDDAIENITPLNDVLKYKLMPIVYLIKEVDGITDKNQIYEWLTTIPVNWSTKLMPYIDNVTDWGVDFTYKTQCQDCGEELLLPIPVNPISFFI